MSVFIDDECDGPGGGDFDDFDDSDGSSCSDDEQHAGGQFADQPTTGGLYVTEADAHGTAATFAGLEARHRRGRGVGDERGDPEEPRAPQRKPTLEDALKFSLGHAGVLQWGVAVVFDYQVKRRRNSKKGYYCQPEIRNVEGLLDLIFAFGNGQQSEKRDSAYGTAVRRLCEILNRAHYGASEEGETLLFYVKCLAETEAYKVVGQEKYQKKVTEKQYKWVPPPVGINALTQVRAKALVGIGPGSVERKALEVYMAELHKMVAGKLSKYRCNSKQRLTKVRDYAVEHASRDASSHKARRIVRAEEKRQWMETTMQPTAEELEKTGRRNKTHPFHKDVGRPWDWYNPDIINGWETLSTTDLNCLRWSATHCARFRV
jgi:hypothetical protein